MKLTLEEIKKMNVCLPFVLIKIAGLNNMSVVDKRLPEKEQVKYLINPNFEKERHTQVIGEVVTVGTGEMVIDGNMMAPEWLCDINLKSGDEVVIEYMAIRVALGDYGGGEPKFVIADGDAYIWVGYQFIICAKRNGKILPQNGFILCDPLPKLAMQLNGQALNQDSELYARVTYLGDLIKEYHDGSGAAPDRDNIHEGEIVAFEPHCDQPVEHFLHAKFFGGDRLIYMHRRNIIAKFTEQPVESL